MRRDGRAEVGAIGRVYEKIRRLILDNRDTVAPMRSIARELEESWPTSEP